MTQFGAALDSCPFYLQGVGVQGLGFEDQYSVFGSSESSRNLKHQADILKSPGSALDRQLNTLPVTTLNPIPVTLLEPSGPQP